MYFDLSVTYISDHTELQRTIRFLTERKYRVGYGTIALDLTITGKVPTQIFNQIPVPLPFPQVPNVTVLRRCTLLLSDPGQNYRLSQLSSVFDIFALRPTTEKAFQLACQSLECDLISLDFTIRYPFYFQIKTVKSALDRGIKFEICYGPGILNVDGGASRRNLISNATQLIRATRGRGIIISSEAKKALACRSPQDVINLASLWGLSRDRGTEAVGREARSVVVQAEMKRKSYRGVIDVVYGGEEPHAISIVEGAGMQNKVKNKRKAAVLDEEAAVIGTEKKPISKREQKRQANKARQELVETTEGDSVRSRGPPSGELVAVSQPGGTNVDEG